MPSLDCCHKACHIASYGAGRQYWIICKKKQKTTHKGVLKDVMLTTANAGYTATETKTLNERECNGCCQKKNLTFAVATDSQKYLAAF